MTKMFVVNILVVIEKIAQITTIGSADEKDSQQKENNKNTTT